MWTTGRPSAVPSPGLGEADQRALIPVTLGGKLIDGTPVGVDEVALQVEVLGRIAGNAELREDDQVDPSVAGAPDPLPDLARIAVDVADGRVDLGEPKADLRCSCHIWSIARLIDR